MSIDSIKKRNAELKAAGKLPPAGKPAARRTFKQPIPCIYLGSATGETRPCKTCTGTIQVPLMVCNGGKGVCSETRLVKTEDGQPITCCRLCTLKKTE